MMSATHWRERKKDTRKCNYFRYKESTIFLVGKQLRFLEHYQRENGKRIRVFSTTLSWNSWIFYWCAAELKSKKVSVYWCLLSAFFNITNVNMIFIWYLPFTEVHVHLYMYLKSTVCFRASTVSLDDINFFHPRYIVKHTCIKSQFFDNIADVFFIHAWLLQSQ